MRWTIALLAAFAIVAVVANVMKVIVESQGIGYTIHWFETVPFIVFVFAFFIQKQLDGEPA